MKPRRYGKLRTFQAEVLDLARDISEGETAGLDVVVIGCTPGGGKTRAAALFCTTLLDAGVHDFVLYVVPNNPLKKQVVQHFDDRANGLTYRLTDKSSELKNLPLMPNDIGEVCGLVVTYSAIGANPEKFARILRLFNKPLVVFDEIHHLRIEDDDTQDEASLKREWSTGASIVRACASRVLAMSGTLWRHDGRGIPFIPRDQNGEAIVHVRYTRGQALEERAVIGAELHFYDGRSVYEYRGRTRDGQLSESSKTECRRAVRNALQSAEFSEALIIHAVEAWLRYRDMHRGARMIVVAQTQSAAKRADRLIRAKFPLVQSVLAVSDMGKEGDANVNRFRRHNKDLHVLCTVRKAYEGLDVRDVKVIVYLSAVRSWSFLDQCFARATRVDDIKRCGREWAEQRAILFMIDDRLMREWADNMFSEQADAIGELKPQLRDGTGELHQSSFKAGFAEINDVPRFAVNDLRFDDDLNQAVHELNLECPETRALPLATQATLATYRRTSLRWTKTTQSEELDS